MTKLNVNGKTVEVDVDPETPLLWVLRDTLGLTGTKFGCGMALCGACTVHLERRARPLLPDSRQCRRRPAGDHHRGAVHGSQPSGAAGLDRARRSAMRLLPVRPDHVGHGAARQKPRPSDADIDAAMSGNICRCGTYQRIRAAIRRASEIKGPEFQTTTMTDTFPGRERDVRESDTSFRAAPSWAASSSPSRLPACKPAREGAPVSSRSSKPMPGCASAPTTASPSSATARRWARVCTPRCPCSSPKSSA